MDDIKSLALNLADAISYQDLLKEYNERVTIREPNDARVANKKDKDSRFVPIKLKPEEAKRAMLCQKMMLDFALAQYKESIGTDKEEAMRILYNDAVADYKTFMEQHKEELS